MLMLIKGGRVIDPGNLDGIMDILIANGKIAEIGAALSPGEAAEVVDASGRWLTPGLWDIHTHLDLEVELDPSLSEVVRHGTTTAVVANCSIGVPFGRQNDDGHEPVVSCFARVENIPKSVLMRVAERIGDLFKGDRAVQGLLQGDGVPVEFAAKAGALSLPVFGQQVDDLLVLRADEEGAVLEQHVAQAPLGAADELPAVQGDFVLGGA